MEKLVITRVTTDGKLKYIVGEELEITLDEAKLKFFEFDKEAKNFFTLDFEQAKVDLIRSRDEAIKKLEADRVQKLKEVNTEFDMKIQATKAEAEFQLQDLENQSIEADREYESLVKKRDHYKALVEAGTDLMRG